MIPVIGSTTAAIDPVYLIHRRVELVDVYHAESVFLASDKLAAIAKKPSSLFDRDP
jgi:hypothetical protein